MAVVSIETVMAKEAKDLRPSAGEKDPSAFVVTILLLHHIDDLLEALEEDNVSAARVSQKDIREIVENLDSWDLDRIRVVFRDGEGYTRFSDNLIRVLGFDL